MALFQISALIKMAADGAEVCAYHSEPIFRTDGAHQIKVNVPQYSVWDLYFKNLKQWILENSDILLNIVYSIIDNHVKLLSSLNGNVIIFNCLYSLG